MHSRHIRCRRRSSNIWFSALPIHVHVHECCEHISRQCNAAPTAASATIAHKSPLPLPPLLPLTATDSQVNFALHARACTLLYGLNAISFRTNGMLEQLYSKTGFSGYGSFATTARKQARGRISASASGTSSLRLTPARRVCKAVGCQNGSHAVRSTSEPAQYAHENTRRATSSEVIISLTRTHVWRASN